MRHLLMVVILTILSFTIFANDDDSSYIEVVNVKKLGLFDCDYVDPKKVYVKINFIWEFETEDFSIKKFQAVLTHRKLKIEFRDFMIPSPISSIVNDVITLKKVKQGSLTGTFNLSAREACSVLGDDINIKSFNEMYKLIFNRLQ